ncbi:MAG TPA: ABC transporter permease, partial [Rubrobacteraceae bacterium]|nr:ABC transporter permease [Rubrobacteraceae bacterium]
RSYSLLLDLNQSIVQETISNNIGDVRLAQEQIDELNRQLEEVNLAAETLASEEGQETTADLDETLAELEGSLETLQDAPGETGEEASTTLEQVRDTREQLDEVREAQEDGAEEIRDRTGISELDRTLTNLQDSFAEVPTETSPRVLANPFRLELENLASPPDILGFYAPAVLGLLVQHIAVSLASLAVIRERLSGAYEFFEVSPLGPGELLFGKFLTYFGLVLGANLAVAAVLAVFLGIPIVGGVWSMVLGMALLTVASLGVGFFISALARSELQAVQVSMLMLIASVLFAGFAFPLSDIQGPALAISYLLPATYGIRSLQDIMIRGEGISYFDLAGLLVISLACLGLARYLMHRKKR